MPDYEIVSRLQKLVDAHHDFTLVSRRYDDPALRLAARSPTGPGPPSRLTRTPERSQQHLIIVSLNFIYALHAKFMPHKLNVTTFKRVRCLITILIKLNFVHLNKLLLLVKFYKRWT